MALELYGIQSDGAGLRIEPQRNQPLEGFVSFVLKRGSPEPITQTEVNDLVTWISSNVTNVLHFEPDTGLSGPRRV